MQNIILSCFLPHSVRPPVTHKMERKRRTFILSFLLFDVGASHSSHYLTSSLALSLKFSLTFSFNLLSVTPAACFRICRSFALAFLCICLFLAPDLREAKAQRRESSLHVMAANLLFDEPLL